MSCTIKSTKDTSFLYKNGELVSSGDVSFDICKNIEVDVAIIRNIRCCKKNKYNELDFIVENKGNQDIVDGKLNIYVSTNNCDFTRTIDIFNLKSKCKAIINIDIPFCCLRHFVKAQIEIEGEVIKEERIIF